MAMKKAGLFSTLALVGAFSVAQSQENDLAMASTVPETTKTITVGAAANDKENENFSVEIDDISDKSLKAALREAWENSKNGMTIVYMGNNPELIKMVQEGVSIANDKGKKVHKFLQTKPHPKYEGEDRYVIMLAGARVTEFIDPSEDLEDTTDRAKRMVFGSYARFGDLVVAQNKTPGHP